MKIIERLPESHPDVQKAFGISAQDNAAQTHSSFTTAIARSVESPEFWRSLKADLEATRTQTMSLRRFLHNYDDTSGTALYWLEGKYKALWYAFSDTQTGENRMDLDTYIAQGFPVPEDPHFGRTVQEVRSLIDSKFKKADDGPREDLYKLVDPEFWKEFVDDLSDVPEKTSFHKFLQHYDPARPSSVEGKTGQMIKGKYRKLFYQFQDTINDQNLREVFGNELVPPNYHELTPEQRDLVFFEVAPTDVQVQLAARFPKTFGEKATEIKGVENLIPPEAQLVLKTASLLRADQRDSVLKALTTYIKALGEDTQLASMPDESVKVLLDRVSTKIEPSEQGAKVFDLKTIYQDYQDITQALKIGQDEAGEVAAKQELVSALEESYFLPLVKNELYKPVSLFWTAFQDQHEGQPPTPDLLVNFLSRYVQVASSGVISDLPSAQGTVDYFNTQILPRIYQNFTEIASYASEVKHFRKYDEQGKPKHLFFHQLEAIKLLTDSTGYILSDEPGTGKTIILALAALNNIDKKPITNRPGRILVAGTKAVIDNWELELGKHIEPGTIDVANVNFPDEGDTRNVKWRLKKLEALLQAPEHENQFILVNYDLFRDPQLQRILSQYEVDSKIVDEAHNVKSRFLKSILDQAPADDTGGRVAKRTSGLYSFLKGSPDSVVYLATSTPFVKEFVEPLIMAHLVRPADIPSDVVRRNLHDAVGTHRLLKMVMLRRAKETIADLPSKDTQFLPVDLSSLSDENKAEFQRIAQELMNTHDGKFARMYALLNLEGQVKYPWLIDKVQELTAAGKKVVVFTPFTSGEDRLTASISTVAVAERLRDAGAGQVGILDGNTPDRQRRSIQEDFLRKGGTNVIVGNYLVAGESITLCSPENRATEVILFIGPNAISRYLQAIDRVHRFGQTEGVTIHVPYVTNDLLGRSQGTYDERIVKRLNRELTRFGSVIDGLFFVESADFFQATALESIGVTDKNINFEVARKSSGDLGLRAGGRRGKKPFRPLPEEKPFVLGQSQEISFIGEEQSVINHSINIADKELIDSWFTQSQKYPLLTSEQAKLLFEHLRKGSEKEQFMTDERFAEFFPVQGDPKFQNLFGDSSTITDLIAYSNLRLVISSAQKWFGLPLLDKIQEGNIGLLKAIDMFDPQRGAEFSTYAVWWINQTIARAVPDTAFPIRIPVHMYESANKARNLTRQFTTEQGRAPTTEELKSLLINKADFVESNADLVIRTLQSGVTNVRSLDAALDPHSVDSKALGEFIGDVREDVEAEVIENETAELVRTIMQEVLSKREQDVITARFGLDGAPERTLEEVGAQLEVTRERIRQIEKKALAKLKLQDRMRHAWQDDAPSFLYRTSAEDAAFRLGLFKDDKETTVFDKSKKGSSDGEIKPEPIRYRWSSRVVNGALRQAEVWNELPPQEQSILRLYFRSGLDTDLTRERLKRIFGYSDAQLNTTINTSVVVLEQSLKERFDRDNSGTFSQELRTLQLAQIKEMRQANINDAQIARRLGMGVHTVQGITSQMIKNGEIERLPRRSAKESHEKIDRLVRFLVSQNPNLSNSDIALSVSQWLDVPVNANAVSNSKSRLRQEGVTVFNRLTPNQAKALDPEVEQVIVQNPQLTNSQIAQQLQRSENQVQGSVQRLRRRGNIIPFRTPDSRAREALERYVAERPAENINLSEFARGIGISRERARQLYDKIIEARFSDWKENPGLT